MTEKAKHTPGPWTVQIEGRHFVDIVVDTDDVLVIAEIDTHNIDAPPRTQCIANARLMAAAPDMLEAHEPGREGPDFLDWIADRMVNVYGESENVDFVVCLRRRAAKAREAIAKATGGEA